MSELWDCVGFVVLDGEHDASEVAAALPVEVRSMREAPRRHALAMTIHDGTVHGGNETCFAVFAADGRTFVAPPGGVSSRTGETHWQRALSRRFGRAHWFSAYEPAPAIAVFEGGEPIGASSPSREDDVLDALSAFLSVADARTYLSQPQGRCVILEVEAGRW